MAKLILALALFVSACSPGNPTDGFRKVCMEGHLYWERTCRSCQYYAIAPILFDNGKPRNCAKGER